MPTRTKLTSTVKPCPDVALPPNQFPERANSPLVGYGVAMEQVTDFQRVRPPAFMRGVIRLSEPASIPLTITLPGGLL